MAHKHNWLCIKKLCVIIQQCHIAPSPEWLGLFVLEIKVKCYTMMKVAHPPCLAEGWCLRVQISLGLWRENPPFEYLWSAVSPAYDLISKPMTRSVWKGSC